MLCPKRPEDDDAEIYPRGHYYSPLPDRELLKSNSDAFFKTDVESLPGIILNEKNQQTLLEKLAVYYDEFPWIDEKISTACRFHLNQDFFCHGDAIVLYMLLRHLRPQRVIEVGSGFSSALMLDTNDLFLDSTIRFTFIEPFPKRLHNLLFENDRKNTRVIADFVQDEPLTTFDDLQKNDILFIDSTHVSKIGSDVNHLIFNVLPKLNPGVIIHFHDIFWPFEYPLQWFLNGRDWNEAYLLRAFLQFNTDFEILIFNSFAGHFLNTTIERTMPLFMKNTGGSLWLRKLC